MYSSQSGRKMILPAIYQSVKTVFKLIDIAMLTGISDFQSLNKSLNYYVRTGQLIHLRKGIYAKSAYSFEELANTIYTPSYISLQYVLQKEGVIFQYDSRITSVSYLSREIMIKDLQLRYRKIKDTVLVNPAGLIRKDDVINYASPERAFLDLLYLDQEYYFDNINILDKQRVFEILPIYQSRALAKRVDKLITND